MTDLGTLGGTYSAAQAINASGTVIGQSYLPGDTGIDPFIYSNGTMTDLMTLLPPGAGVTNVTVLGINNRGQIVGQGVDSNGNFRALLLTPSDDGIGDVGNNVPAIAGTPRREGTSLAKIAALGTSLGGSHQTNNAPFAPSQALVGSSPSSSNGATSTPQGTVQLGTAPNDGLHQFAPSHRRAASAASWEVLDRVFADFDS
jgi:probable HAF family extracellular repeat protein